MRLFLITLVLASLALAQASKAHKHKRSSDVGTYEYDSWEEIDEATEDGEDYQGIEDQLSADIDAKDWEKVWKKVLGPAEFQTHYQWLQKLHDLHSKRTNPKQVSEPELIPETPQQVSQESQEAVQAEALLPVQPGVYYQAIDDSAEDWSDEVQEDLKASQEEANLDQTKPKNGESDEDILDAIPLQIIEEKPKPVSEFPEDYDDYGTGWSDESEEVAIPAAPLEEAEKVQSQEQVFAIVPEFNMKDDMMHVPENGGEEEDSEIIIETVPGKSMDDIIKSMEDSGDGWMSPRIVYYAQTHKNMMMAVTLMFFILTIITMAITLYRTFRLCKELPSAAPGSYQRMDEDTESLYSQKV